MESTPSDPARQDRELRSSSVPQQPQREAADSSRRVAAESSRRPAPTDPAPSQSTNDISVKDWEVLAMHLVECWLRTENDPHMRLITLRHMTEFDAAQATGVISALPPGQEARLRESVLAHRDANYEVIAANLPKWVAQFRNGPPRRRYALPTFTGTTATPPPQHIQRTYRRSWDGTRPPPVLSDLLDDTPAPAHRAADVPPTRPSFRSESVRLAEDRIIPIESRLTELESRAAQHHAGITGQFRDTARQLEDIHRTLTQLSVNPPALSAQRGHAGTPPAPTTPVPAPEATFPPPGSTFLGPQHSHSPRPFQYPANTMGAPYATMPQATPAPTHWGGYSAPLPGHQHQAAPPAPATLYQSGHYGSERPRRLKPDDVMVFDPQEVDVHLFTQRLRFVATHEGVYPVLSVLPFCLKGRAREWHTTLGPQAQRMMSTSLDSALFMLEREFRKDPIEARQEANQLRFSFGGSISLPEYLTKKISLLRAAGAYDLEGLKYDLWYGLEDSLASLAPILQQEPLEDFCSRIRSLESGARRNWMALRRQPDNRRRDAGFPDRTPFPSSTRPRQDPVPTSDTKVEPQRPPLAPTQRQPRPLPRPCRHCGGQHYDNHCPARKVQFAEHADVIHDSDMADLQEFESTASPLMSAEPPLDSEN